MLLTKTIENQIPALYSTEEIPTGEKNIIAKFFALASGWTWYVVEGERQENGDYIFFGLIKGHELELGYFVLSELESLKWHGIPRIERDLNFSPVKVKEIFPQYALFDVIEEYCPYCERETELKDIFEPQPCSHCSNMIFPCSICENRVCENCPLKVEREVV